LVFRQNLFDGGLMAQIITLRRQTNKSLGSGCEIGEYLKDGITVEETGDDSSLVTMKRTDHIRGHILTLKREDAYSGPLLTAARFDLQGNFIGIEHDIRPDYVETGTWEKEFKYTANGHYFSRPVPTACDWSSSVCVDNWPKSTTIGGVSFSMDWPGMSNTNTASCSFSWNQSDYKWYRSSSWHLWNQNWGPDFDVNELVDNESILCDQDNQTTELVDIWYHSSLDALLLELCVGNMNNGHQIVSCYWNGSSFSPFECGRTQFMNALFNDMGYSGSDWYWRNGTGATNSFVRAKTFFYTETGREGFVVPNYSSGYIYHGERSSYTSP